jgi:MFS family permease
VYVQGVIGMSAQNSGAIMTPMMLSFIVGALVSGQLMTRTGQYKGLAIGGGVLMVIGLFLMSRLGPNATWAVVVRDMLVMGVGIGGLMPILSLAVQNAFPYHEMGTVTATQQFLTSLGGVIASPILGTVLTSVFGARLKVLLPRGVQLPAAAANPQNLINAGAQQAIQAQFSQLGANGAAVYQVFIHAVRVALADGMQRLFLIALVFGLAALVATLFLPRIRLKRDEFFSEDAQDPGVAPAD